MFSNYVVEESSIITQFTHTTSQKIQTLPFILKGGGHFICGDKYFTERKGLKDYLLIYTKEGEGYIEYRGVKATAKEGTAFLINCDEYHLYRTGETGTWEFYYAHILGASLKTFSDLINSKGIEVVRIQNTKIFDTEFNEMNLLIGAKLNAEVLDIKLSLSLAKILTALVEDKQSNRITQYNRHFEDIERAKRFIEVNFSKPVDLTMLAKEVNISKYYFIKIFKEIMGQTPYDYLISTRISESKKLLSYANANIGEIAGQVGFADVNNFIKTFKKFTGTTPLKFRQHWVA